MSLTLTLERGGGEISGSGTNIELDGTIAGGAIESVEMYGDTEQTTYSGKNLLDESLMVQGTFNYLNNQDSAHSGIIRMSSFIPCQSNTTYTISSNAILGEFAVVYKDSNGNVVEGSGWSIEDSTYTSFTTKSNAVQMRVRVGKGAYPHTAGVNYALQIELGGQPTSYEPYVGGTASPNPDYPQTVQTVTGRQVVTITDSGSQSQEYEINLGKNLFDKGNANTIAAYIQWTTPRVLNYSSGNSSVYIPCQPNTTYTISKVADNVFRAGSIEEEPTTGITVYNAEENPTGTSITITTSSKAKYIVVFLRNNASTNSLETILASLQIEKGSTATTYASYFEPIKLCKIGTYKDVIFQNVPSSSYYSSALDEGSWYLHKEINQLALNGSESWETTGTNVYALYVSGGIKSITGGLLGVCNYYTFNPVQTSVTTTLTAGQFAIQYITPNTQHRLFMKNTSISTTSDFQTWLGTHNTKVYYPLATPTNTQITNSALIAQLNALNEATTYDGTTVITVSSENLAGLLEVTAAASIAKTYTEVEIGSPFTITDVEGKSSNTTLDGNVYVDWAYNKKQYSFDLFNLTPQDYADIRAFYDYQFNNSAFPTITVPELNIDKLPVYMEISSRNIINQCLLTDKLTIKFRETVQP